MVALRAASLRAVVLTYGTGGEHEALLASLLGAGVPAERILVVHNPADPGEPDPSIPPGCELLRSSHNLGYAGGMNQGIARQLCRDCELIALLTHDARLRKGALETLVEAARENPGFGVLGPALVLAGTEKPFSFGGITRANGTMAHRRARSEAEPDPCDWVDGGTMLVRVEALRQAGGFDERLWSYCEEADLCLRISRAGYRIGVVTGAIAEQAPGGPKRIGPWSYLMTRNGGAYAWRAAGPYGLTFFTLRAVSSLLYGLLRAALRRLRLRSGLPGDPWAGAVGTARGLLDLYGRRWGPPPPLPGTGDVSNVIPPDGEDGGGG